LQRRETNGSESRGNADPDRYLFADADVLRRSLQVDLVYRVPSDGDIRPLIKQIFMVVPHFLSLLFRIAL